MRIFFIVVVSLLSACSNKEAKEAMELDITQLMLPSVIYNFENTGYDVFMKKTQTKSPSDNFEIFELRMMDDRIRREFVVYMKVEFKNDLIVVEDFTVEKGLLATHYYTMTGRQIDVNINYNETKGWFSDWWGCTNSQYQEQKRRAQEYDESMSGEVMSDWLPINSLRAAASGLYCMGAS